MNPHLNLYPQPYGIPASDRYAVTVNGKPSFTYMTTSPVDAPKTVGHTVSWTSFDFDGTVEVRIRRLDRPANTVIVRPRSAGVAAEMQDGEIVLKLDKPCKLSVECDRSLQDVLFIFANEPETDAPERGDPGVVWFDAGVHEIGKYYRLAAGKTYYLAPGAFLKGSFAGGGDGTRVIGRGVLSGADYKWHGHLQEKNPDRIDLVKLAGDGIELSGITLVDSPYYVVIAGGRGNVFRNMKIMAWYLNTDGISAGPGAVIEDCFLRTCDDAFKPFVSDTRISRCVLWTDGASPFQLTWNARKDSGGSIVEDCDVIHHLPFVTEYSEWYGYIFWSWHGGTGHIHDILLDSIRVEDRSPGLISIHFDKHPWAVPGDEWGRFSNIHIRNVTVDEPFRFPSKLLGRNAGHNIDGVTFENVQIAGRQVRSAEDLNLETNEFVKNVRFVNYD